MKALVSLINSCAMPDFHIEHKQDMLGLVFKLSFLMDEGAEDKLKWCPKSPTCVYQCTKVWPLLKMDIPLIYNDNVDGAINSLGRAIYEFLMYFQPFNRNLEQLYPC